MGHTHPSRGFSAVLTSPGLIARQVKPSGLSAAANCATTMFSAAFETEYAMPAVQPEPMTNSGSPSPEEIVMMRLAAPARRSGRKAFVENADPMALLRNYNAGGEGECISLSNGRSERTASRRSASNFVCDGLRERIVRYG